jgi:hypothetical protein
VKAAEEAPRSMYSTEEYFPISLISIFLISVPLSDHFEVAI